MKRAFILWHVHELKDREDDTKLVGVYATRREARLAQTRAKQLPGFRQHPKGFMIDAYEIGKDHWTEGFVTGYPGLKLKGRRTRHSRGRRARVSVSNRALLARPLIASVGQVSKAGKSAYNDRSS